MIVDLKCASLDDGFSIEFSIEKPKNFAAFCKKWQINNEGRRYDFEFYLSEQLSYFTFGDISISSFRSTLSKLKIPSEIPVRVRYFKPANTDSYTLGIGTIFTTVTGYIESSFEKGEPPF